MKKCSRCGEIKQLSEFYKMKGYKMKWYTHSYCKKCTLEYYRKRYKEDPEYRKKSKLIRINWKKNNYKKMKLWRKEYRLRSYVKQKEKDRALKLKMKIYNKLGLKCSRCGFDDIRALQIDHVNGGGAREIKKITNRRIYHKKVLSDTKGNYQILCANCNWIKRAERNEYKT